MLTHLAKNPCTQLLTYALPLLSIHSFIPCCYLLRIELPYWPPAAWLALTWRPITITLEAHEHYQKGTYRNRCHLGTANGVQRLSIPLASGKHQQLPIREVRIAHHEHWQRQHWRAICSAYGNAPYFAHYAPEIEAFYQTPTPYLFDFNWTILTWLCKKMRHPATFVFSQQYALEAVESDARNVILPDAAVPDTLHLLPYPQHFQDRFGFRPNLSALDVLLCCGPSPKIAKNEYL